MTVSPKIYIDNTLVDAKKHAERARSLFASLSPYSDIVEFQRVQDAVNFGYNRIAEGFQRDMDSASNDFEVEDILAAWRPALDYISNELAKINLDLRDKLFDAVLKDDDLMLPEEFMVLSSLEQQKILRQSWDRAMAKTKIDNDKESVSYKDVYASFIEELGYATKGLRPFVGLCGNPIDA